MKKIKIVLPASFLVLATLVHTNSIANGYEFLHQSAEGLGSAYATNGTAINDISAMFSNPASIIRFDGIRASGNFTLDLPRSEMDKFLGSNKYEDILNGKGSVKLDIKNDEYLQAINDQQIEAAATGEYIRSARASAAGFYDVFAKGGKVRPCVPKPDHGNANGDRFFRGRQ